VPPLHPGAMAVLQSIPVAAPQRFVTQTVETAQEANRGAILRAAVPGKLHGTVIADKLAAKGPERKVG
jgi:hypothetical protein